MQGYQPQYLSLPAPIPTAPTRSGSTTCRPMVLVWMIKESLKKKTISPISSKNIISFGQEKVALIIKKAKAFTVKKAEIAENKYDLSINRYKEIEYEEVEYDPPEVILDQLDALEKDIQKDLKQLRKMLG